MFYTYILQSKTTNKYYIGSTQNIEKHLTQHNSGKSKSTRYDRPWELKYQKDFFTRSEAVRYERYLKSLKKRIQLEKIIAAG